MSIHERDKCKLRMKVLMKVEVDEEDKYKKIYKQK